MPVILRFKGYKFWFYEADLNEPPHVHVGKESTQAKYWLKPVRLAYAGRFKPVDLNEIERVINDNLNFLLIAWARECNKRVNG